MEIISLKFRISAIFMLLVLTALFHMPSFEHAKAASNNSILIQDFSISDLTGRALETMGTAQRGILTSSLRNIENESISFVLIIDIRDKDGSSIDIIFSDGEVGPQETTNISATWTPEKTGTFSARQFVVTDLDAPQILSSVSSHPLRVSEESELLVLEVELLTPTEQPKEDELVDDDAPASLTLMIYMVASDLESQGYSATSDIKEMMDADIASNVNIVIQTGGSKNATIDDDRFIDFTKVQRHEILDDDIELVTDLGEKNMGDSKTLQEFISWSMKEYPAEKYAIILWDHGNGIRGFGYDDIFNDYLTIRELTDAFSKVKQQTLMQFEFIGFDACLMATYEVAARISPYGHYLVSSEEVIPEWGWDYRTLLSSLEDVDQMDGRSIGKIIADSYVAHSKTKTELYENYEADRWITMSVIDLSKMEDLRQRVKDMGDSIHRHMSQLEQAQTLAKTLQYTERYGIDYGGSAGYSDLYELTENMGESFPAYKSLADILRAEIEEAVVYNVHGESKPNAHGMSIYLQLDEYKGGDEHLFYLDSEWLGVIETGAKRLAEDTDAPTGWLDYSSGELEGESYVDDISYGFISFYKESEGSRYELISYYYLDPSRFLQEDGSIEYELNEGVLSLCDADDCAPAFVYLEDNGDSQLAYFPVRLVSEEYDDRVTLIYEIDRNDFIFIGAWEGVEDGTAQRGLRPLQNGDQIFTFTHEYDRENEDYYSELESEPIDVTDNFGPEYVEYEEEYVFAMAFCDYGGNCAYSSEFEL